MRLRQVIDSTTFSDRLLFGFLVIISLLALLSIHQLVPRGSVVRVDINHRPAYRYSLNKDRVVHIQGVVIEIKDRRIRVREASCPNRICIRQGWIERGSIICIPNKVIITIESPSSPEEELDGITG